MNKLILGLAEKTELLDTKQGFLLVDDGPLCDKFLKRFKRAKVFDPAVHSFNPLSGINYRRAREFADILYTASPQGTDTLTVRNGKRALARLLLRNFKSLDKIESYLWKKAQDHDLSPTDAEALGTLGDVLLSPVLKKVLCERTNFSFRNGNPPSSIVARINRAELGEFDAFILGSLLVSMYPGQVIIPDFGFYARDFHAALIRKKRLAVGLNCLAELDKKMQQLCLLMEDKWGRQCTFADAKALAEYTGLRPDPLKVDNPYNNFIDHVMQAA